MGRALVDEHVLDGYVYDVSEQFTWNPSIRTRIASYDSVIARLPRRKGHNCSARFHHEYGETSFTEGGFESMQDTVCVLRFHWIVRNMRLKFSFVWNLFKFIYMLLTAFEDRHARR